MCPICTYQAAHACMCVCCFAASSGSSAPMNSQSHAGRPDGETRRCSGTGLAYLSPVEGFRMFWKPPTCWDPASETHGCLCYASDSSSVLHIRALISARRREQGGLWIGKLAKHARWNNFVSKSNTPRPELNTQIGPHPPLFLEVNTSTTQLICVPGFNPHSSPAGKEEFALAIVRLDGSAWQHYSFQTRTAIDLQCSTASSMISAE